MGKDRSADGLRGVAAASVVVHHFLLAFFPVGLVHLYPWVAATQAPSGMTERVVSSPLLSSLWNGQLPVSIFFVLSGYVLTRKYFLTGDAENIRSQAARRYIRLGIPVFASVLFAVAVYSLVGYDIGPAEKLTRSAWLLRNTPPTDLATPLREGLYGAVLQGRALSNHVLWTMQVEFIGSMLIFGYALIAGRRHLIMSGVFVAVVFFLAPLHWPYFLGFLAGAHIGRMRAPRHKAIPYAMAALGWLIASISPTAPGWSHVPVAHGLRLAVVSVAGGVLIVYAVRFNAGSGILQSRIAQFLGRISYPLYLIHLPILLSAGCLAFVSCTHAGASRGLAASVALACFIGLTLPLSWLFERYIDVQAIRLAKWAIGSRTSGPQALADAP